MLTFQLRPMLAAAAFIMTLTSQPAMASSFDTVEAAQQATLATYQKVYIAPVTMSLEESDLNLLTTRRRTANAGAQHPLTDEEQARKSADLHRELTRQFGKHFTLVDAPTNDALTVSAAITRITASRLSNEQRRRGVGSLNFVESVAAGGVDYSVELGTEGAVLYQIQDSYRGSLNDGLPRTGVWQDADYSFRRFAKQLSRFVRGN